MTRCYLIPGEHYRLRFCKSNGRDAKGYGLRNLRGCNRESEIKSEVRQAAFRQRHVIRKRIKWTRKARPSNVEYELATSLFGF